MRSLWHLHVLFRTSALPLLASSIHSTAPVITSQDVACASMEVLLAGLPSTSLITTGPAGMQNRQQMSTFSWKSQQQLVVRVVLLLLLFFP